MLIEKKIISVIEMVPNLVAEVLRELSKQAPLNSQDKMDLNLLLEEAITNAIQHGNQFDTSRHVELTVEYAPEGMVTMRIKDQGQGFDHKVLPNLKDSNEQMNEYGRGIFLMKKMADEVSFNEAGNEVCIRKRIELKKV